jgi:hypothetical protein
MKHLEVASSLYRDDDLYEILRKLVDSILDTGGEQNRCTGDLIETQDLPQG